MELKVTWKHAIKVWWSYIWRNITAIIIGAILGFAFLIIGTFTKTTSVLLVPIGVIISLFTSIIPIRLILDKDFGEFRLILDQEKEQNSFENEEVSQDLCNLDKSNSSNSMDKTKKTNKKNIMNIEFDVTLADIVYFNKFNFIQSGQMKKLVFRSQLYYVTSVSVIMAILSHATNNWSIYISAGIIGSIIYVLTAKKILLRRIEKNVYQTFKGDDNREMLGIRYIEIQDDGIYVKGQVSEGKTYWDGLMKISEDENYAFIYVGSTKAHVIRKSGILSGRIDIFLDELKNRMETKAENKQEESPAY